MRLAAARILTLLAAILVGTPAFACRLLFCPQRLAPAGGQSLPANARAVIAQGKASARFNPDDGGTTTWSPFIRRLNSDGGVQSLVAAPNEMQPAGEDGTLFLPGELIPGERIRLEASAECGGFPEDPSAEILVGEPAPFPQAFGTPLSPVPIRIEPDDSNSCGVGDSRGTRDVFIDLDESVQPWLSVARVNLEVNGVVRSTNYGRLARGHNGGSRVFVERLTRLCDLEWAGQSNDTLQTWLIKLELELPGVQQRPPPVELSVDMDCRQSCASAGVIPWLLGVLLLGARRATSRSRRSAE